MLDYKELKKVLNSGGMSIKHGAKGTFSVTDSSNFRGMKLSALEEAQQMVVDSIKEDTEKFAEKCSLKQLDTLQTVNQRAVQNVGVIMDCLRSNKPMTAQEIRDKQTSPMGIRDSIVNGAFNYGIQGIDPSRASIAIPNVYISPYEANSLYSQKGIFETVVDKKSKSILLNGLTVKNTHLTAKEIDLIKEKMEVLNFKSLLANATRDSLVYGGALVFPMFKRDTPLSVRLPLSALLKNGILKKNSIDYFITLDRWNTFIIPPYNPTQKDFMMPDVFTVPFLGADVHNSRCGRIVTSQQAGYWGNIINQGWGVSDFCAYLQSGMNYKVTIQSLPLMIQQMSILARTINAEGVLATEGANAMEDYIAENTVKMREISENNPITMDVLGDIKSINRNFAQVPELIRLQRQDFASDARIPEPLLWSSEKGNFSSGDTTEGDMTKQWESIKMVHKDEEPMVKQLVKCIIIDALGTDDRIIRALPYTQIHFDEPVIANAVQRSQIGKFYSETIFNLVSSNVPMSDAVEMASKHISEDFAPSNELLNELKKKQKTVDENDEKRTELEFELQEAQIESMKNAIAMAKEGGTSAPSVRGGSSKDPDSKAKGRSPAEEQKEKALSDKKEKSYSRLEQKKHEKARLGETKRSEKLSKAQNKRV